MFMIYLCIQFHLSNYTDLLVLLSNEKLNEILHGCHIILHYQKYYLKKVKDSVDAASYSSYTTT